MTEGSSSLVYVERELAGRPVRERVTDKYFDATAMCKAAGNKLFADWRRLDTTQALLEVLHLNMGIPIIELIQSVAGRHGGTWVHPKVAIALAMWCSPEFHVRVIDWVYEGEVRNAATWQRLMDELDRRQEFQNQQIAELQSQIQKVNKFVAAFGKDPVATVGNCVKGVLNKRLVVTEQEHGRRFSHLDDGVDELRDEAVFVTFTQILKGLGVSGMDSNGSRGKSFHSMMDEHIKNYPDRATHRVGTGSSARYSKALVREFWGTFKGRALLTKILGPQQGGFNFDGVGSVRH